MCGRYTLATADFGRLRARFALRESLEVRRRFNVAPGDDVLAVIRPDNDRAQVEGTSLRWGLVPFWSQDPREIAAKTINARAETVAQRPAYRDAFERRRCLIVADGFYEWSGGAPHWITLPRGEPFAFAGLWSSWRPQGAAREIEPLRSCAIVTTAAAGAVRALHDRMPVILDPCDESSWMSPQTPPEELHALMRKPPAAAALEYRAVSRAVNDARHDAPDCLDPPEQAALF
ncbi:MAG: SOS response-associated peptidase [Actinobacteria bacterium]|nr:SOS response-associated peptidase [Actinomycetota bacterium]